jgi:dolichol-phosphate mannosyltransferase
MKTNKLSIIIPLYKSAMDIDPLCKSLNLLRSNLRHWDFELVFVDDGCPENSMSFVQNFQFKEKINVRFVKLSRNFGQQNAFLAGLQHATGNHFVNISADLQDDPNLIVEMIALVSKGAEIVICNRTKRSDGTLNDLMSLMAYKFLKHEVSRIPSGGFDYFLLGSKARKELLELRGKYRYLQSDILTLGFPVAYLPYERQKRLLGKSSYTIGKKLRIFSNALLDSSFGMIHTITGVGLIVSISGILLSISVIVGYFLGDSPFPGFAAIFSAILIFNGVVIFTLGILGQYVWRIYDIARNRPDYIVENLEDVNF